MAQTFVERLTSTKEGMRLFQQERLILQVTNVICELMASQDTSRSELANSLGRTKGYVTQLLDGRANMTLRTVSDVFVALGRTVLVSDGPTRSTSKPLKVIKADWTLKPQHWDTLYDPPRSLARGETAETGAAWEIPQKMAG